MSDQTTSDSPQTPESTPGGAGDDLRAKAAEWLARAEYCRRTGNVESADITNQALFGIGYALLALDAPHRCTCKGDTQ